MIFSLIPQAPPLKQLFLNWSALNLKERARLDVKILLWCCPKRRQLYKSLREAMIRWENIQETQGAPGCEPAMIPSCYSQFEEELGNLVCNLETFFIRKYENMYDPVDRRTNSPQNCKRDTFMLLLSCKDYCRFIGNPKTRSLRSVHSWACFVDNKNSEEELSGYLTN
ncbi:hypothetical protein KPH14_006659 [Odynerus spinipes]|uniref:Uncharacterized protein n=1 Tax=Odynerus spinipes TaxID=1348599 RepID=A0AAD9RR67_9HYME|nr:hypothetical protein KPH14_006659 [Odynerus spinipes]